ncbi:Aldo/keto reductase [Thozetella sp. PMI_491]|nr:Aldo/keto reductase [Thozetella sp. PMI_491]
MTYTIQGKEVGPIGFGLMGFTWFAKKEFTDDEIFPVLRTALELGANYWNGGEFYGSVDGENTLTVLKRYFDKYPEDADKVVLNIKGCTTGHPTFLLDSSPEGVKKSVEHSKSILGDKGFIHQFEPARKDPKVDIETTIQAFQEQVKAGNIGAPALSEVNVASIRRASKIAKLGAVEVELSLWNTEPLENGITEACAELDIPILAYCPLSRGILSGDVKKYEDLPEKDMRRSLPKFAPEVFDTNIKLVRAVEELAKSKGATPAQIAINWLVELGKRPGMPKIIPIPGTTSIERLRENSKVVPLTEDDMAAIDKILKEFPVEGDRLNAHAKAWVDNTTL